jgi:hypothetical protein
VDDEASVIIVDDHDQYREDNITLQSRAKKHDILNAWTAVAPQRGHQQPQHAIFPEDEDCKVHDAEGHDIPEVRSGMDRFISMRRNTAEVTVWVTYTGRAIDGCGANFGFQPKIEKNLPEETIIALWKQEAARVHDPGSLTLPVSRYCRPIRVAHPTRKLIEETVERGTADQFLLGEDAEISWENGNGTS